MKKYSLWFKLTIFFQMLTGIAHTLGIVAENAPKNETESTLHDLMNNYKFDLGFGFHHSMQEIMTSFSITFSLFLFFTALMNAYLLRSDLPKNVMKGIISINLIAYIICFITMTILTFLPPIICSGMILLMLLFSYLTISKVA